MFKVGDTVKIIPKDLPSLSKGYFHYDKHTKESMGVDDNEIMLGGEYKIIDLSNNGLVAKLLPNAEPEWRGNVDVKHLKLITDVNYCKFKIGDKVAWSNKKSEINFRVASAILSKVYDPGQNSFIVVDVLNSYFIRFDKSNLYLFWEDFELIK